MIGELSMSGMFSWPHTNVLLLEGGPLETYLLVQHVSYDMTNTISLSFCFLLFLLNAFTMFCLDREKQLCIPEVVVVILLVAEKR